MSWNKNTYNCSFLDTIVSFCKEMGIQTEVTNKGKVQGMGLNDDYNCKDFYELRLLTVEAPKGKMYYVEQMLRDEDCDGNDYIVTLRYKTEKTALNLPLEVTITEKNRKFITNDPFLNE